MQDFKQSECVAFLYNILLFEFILGTCGSAGYFPGLSGSPSLVGKFDTSACLFHKCPEWQPPPAGSTTIGRWVVMLFSGLEIVGQEEGQEIVLLRCSWTSSLLAYRTSLAKAEPSLVQTSFLWMYPTVLNMTDARISVEEEGKGF